MAQFYTDDICSFREDPSIVGTVAYTWRDVDGESIDKDSQIYLHPGTPKALQQETLYSARPSTGYVILSFEQPYDLYCLMPESELILVDRALSTGDVVKRKSSDAQSGTILSTSLRCTLRPQCFADEYAAKSYPGAHGVYSKLKAAKEARSLSKSCYYKDQIYDIPAHELTYWKKYREGDYIIYQDWVGQIKHVSDEVTIRLGNGSVVVVHDPVDHFDEPYWLKGSRSSHLHQLLRSMKFDLTAPLDSEDHSRGRLWDVQEIYVGQIVETHKDNLSLGRWIFGEYDANVEPRGIVVDVRPMEIEVSWIHPNMFKPHLEQSIPPPTQLDLDILESDAVTVYDRSRKPERADLSQLEGASYSPDINFATHVRFRDVAGAAVKYASPDSSHGIFRRIPRTATQGYDMNVLQVVKTSTTVTVQWQDASITTEDSTSLVPYNNVDEYDVWPGTYVSFKGGEIDDTDAGVTLCKRIGVVQAADAGERIASVRWFSAPIAAIPKWDPDQTVPPTQYGSISEEISDVSVYEVTAHPALARSRGDLVVVVPDPLPPIDSVGASQPFAFQQLINQAYPVQETSDSYACHNSAQAHRPSFQIAEMSSSKIPQRTASDNIDWFGEVIDLGLDGNMTVRLGAAEEVRDVKLPYDERVVVVAGNDVESVASDEETGDESSSDAWETDSAVENDSAEVNVPRRLPLMSPSTPKTEKTPRVGMSVTEILDQIPLSPEKERFNGQPKIVLRLPHCHYHLVRVPPNKSEVHLSNEDGTPNLGSMSESVRHSIKDKNANSLHALGDQRPHGAMMYRLNRGERDIGEYPGQPSTERFERLLEVSQRRMGPGQTQYHHQEQSKVSRGVCSPSDQMNFDQSIHARPAADEANAAFGGHRPILETMLAGQRRPQVWYPPKSQATMPQASSAPPTSVIPQPIGTTRMPSQFAILSQAPPHDHRFVTHDSRLTSTKMRRIFREYRILRDSLPENVFVRTWDERLDLLRVLIIGPRETPYELAPFLIDFHMGEEFPAQPPHAHFHSWTNGIGKVNPNLYEDGKICLSLLGTWPGDENGNGTWSSANSTMLQVIVSLQGLVLVREPFYNEAGFEILVGTNEAIATSALYTEKAYVLARGFVQAFFEKDPVGMSDIAQWMYLSENGPQLIGTVYKEANALLEASVQECGEDGSDNGVACWKPANEKKKLSRGGAILLGKMIDWLHAMSMSVE